MDGESAMASGLDDLSVKRRAWIRICRCCWSLGFALRAKDRRQTAKFRALRPHFRHASLARWMAGLFLLGALHARVCMYCDGVLWFAGESTEVTCEGEARHDRLHQSQCLSGQVSFPQFLQYCACCMIDMMHMHAIGHALDCFCVV